MTTPTPNEGGTAFFFCGQACSGKSTLARFLETRLPAKRLSVDEHVLARHDVGVFDEELGHLARAAREELWVQGERHLRSGGHVLFDWSLWSRARRAEWAARATNAGHPHCVFFLDAPLDTLRERLESRNRDLPATAHFIPIAELERFAEVFERPTEIEGPSLVTVRAEDHHDDVLARVLRMLAIQERPGRGFT